jgi:hypothetical protein
MTATPQAPDKPGIGFWIGRILRLLAIPVLLAIAIAGSGIILNAYEICQSIGPGNGAGMFFVVIGGVLGVCMVNGGLIVGAIVIGMTIDCMHLDPGRADN